MRSACIIRPHIAVNDPTITGPPASALCLPPFRSSSKPNETHNSQRLSFSPLIHFTLGRHNHFLERQSRLFYIKLPSTVLCRSTTAAMLIKYVGELPRQDPVASALSAHSRTDRNRARVNYVLTYADRTGSAPSRARRSSSTSRPTTRSPRSRRRWRRRKASRRCSSASSMAASRCTLSKPFVIVFPQRATRCPYDFACDRPPIISAMCIHIADHTTPAFRTDDKTAADYQLEGGATLHLVLALRGGQ